MSTPHSLQICTPCLRPFYKVVRNSTCYENIHLSDDELRLKIYRDRRERTEISSHDAITALHKKPYQFQAIVMAMDYLRNPSVSMMVRYL